MRVTMSARATKKAEAKIRSALAITRRNGRPRAATAASKIYSDLRTELVSLQRPPRGSGLGSGHRAVLRGEPDTCARSHSEIIRRRFARDISAVRHLRLTDPDRGAA